VIVCDVSPDCTVYCVDVAPFPTKGVVSEYHWYANPVGLFAHVPFTHVNTELVLTVPLIDGKVSTAGAGNELTVPPNAAIAAANAASCDSARAVSSVIKTRSDWAVGGSNDAAS
jgi:hypothetical protein